MIGQKFIPAGGHHKEDRNRYSDDHKYFIKKSVGNERVFYQKIQGTPLAQYVAKFINDNQESNIVLENLMYEYKYPCCIDIKLGRRMYGYGFPLKRAQWRDEKCAKTTSLKYAMRLTGYLINSPDKQTLNHSRDCKYKSYDETFQTICDLFQTININKQQFIRECESLIHVLQKSDVELFSTSLLIVQDFGKPETLKIKLCDFAYSYFQSDLEQILHNEKDAVDKNIIQYTKASERNINSMIEGIRNIINIISYQLTPNATEDIIN